MNTERKAKIKEEWKVFKALAPKYVLGIAKKRMPTYYQYENMVKAMDALGFTELSIYFLRTRYKGAKRRTKDFDILAQKHSAQSRENQLRGPHSGKLFVQGFINNIEDEELRELFEDRARRLYGDRLWKETLEEFIFLD